MVIVWIFSGILGAVLICAVMNVFTAILTKLFELGIRLQAGKGASRLARIKFRLYALLFAILNVVYRNTVIVIQFNVRPALEFTSTFIGRVTTKSPADSRYSVWQRQRAYEIRKVIEAIDPEHF